MMRGSPPRRGQTFIASAASSRFIRPLRGRTSKARAISYKHMIPLGSGKESVDVRLRKEKKHKRQRITNSKALTRCDPYRVDRKEPSPRAIYMRILSRS